MRRLRPRRCHLLISGQVIFWLSTTWIDFNCACDATTVIPTADLSPHELRRHQRGHARLAFSTARQIIFEFNSPVVTILPPGNALPNTAGVNLYLYRVLESPFTKNQDWRGDRVTPPATRPALGLQLFYLITPLSATPEDNNADAGDDAHLILGLVMLALEENPILNKVHLPAITVNGRAVPAFDADTALPDFIRNSYEQVKVTLLPTSVDELSKIWATINQPYRLSIAYEVSLVELTPTPPPPAGGGIVLSTGVNVITLDPPRLSLLVPTTGALAQVVGGVLQANVLQIRGFGLSFPGQTPIVRVGGKIVEIKPVPAPTDQTLSVTLPTDVDAGPQVDLRVTLNGRTSTPLTFTVNPWLASTKPIRTALDSTSRDGRHETRAPWHRFQRNRASRPVRGAGRRCQRHDVRSRRQRHASDYRYPDRAR